MATKLAESRKLLSLPYFLSEAIKREGAKARGGGFLLPNQTLTLQLFRHDSCNTLLIVITNRFQVILNCLVVLKLSEGEMCLLREREGTGRGSQMKGETLPRDSKKEGNNTVGFKYPMSPFPDGAVISKNFGRDLLRQDVWTLNLGLAKNFALFPEK